MYFTWSILALDKGNAAGSGCTPTLPSWRSELKAPLPPLDGNTRDVTAAVLNVSTVNFFTAVQDRYCRVSHMSAGKSKDTAAKTTRFKASQCSGISLAQHLLLLRSSKPKVWHPDLIRTMQNQFVQMENKCSEIKYPSCNSTSFL